MALIRNLLAFAPMVALAGALLATARRTGPEDLPQPTLRPQERAASLLMEAGTLGEGWSAAFEPETYGPGELYAKIDGGAEVYLAHGFRRLEVYSFVHAFGDYVEVLLFDQGEGARALYELEKPPDAEEDPRFGGYFSGPNLFMVHDSLYVQILAPTDTPRTREAVRALGARILEMPR